MDIGPGAHYSGRTTVILGLCSTFPQIILFLDTHRNTISGENLNSSSHANNAKLRKAWICGNFNLKINRSVKKP